MKENRKFMGLTTLALLVAGSLVPAAVQAKGNEDSPQVTQLLEDVKSRAYQLKTDAHDMDAFARSGVSWRSHAEQITKIREHINESGKLLAKLQEVKHTGSSWQQMAIERIDPLLRELDDNTEKTIEHLNANQGKVHFQEFKEYVRANYELSVDLEALIRDFVEYGKAKERFERLVEDKEVTG